METRWSFLAPWCVVLQDRLELSTLDCEENYIDTRKFHLQVTLPSREGYQATTRGGETYYRKKKNFPKEEKFQLELQKVREALALLAAVAHADDRAWKYLLEKHCNVPIGDGAEELMGTKLPAKFILFLDENQYQNDLVKFCGVRQREHPSVEYLDALANIAAQKESLTLKSKAEEVQIPVKVHASPCTRKSEFRLMKVLAEVQRQEKIIEDEWRLYEQRKGDGRAKPGSMRCTFVLEPMIVDFSDCTIAADTADAMEKLVRENVWASEVSVRLTMDPELEDKKRSATGALTHSVMVRNQMRDYYQLGKGVTPARGEKEVFCRLMTSVFDSTCRSYQGANMKYHLGDDAKPSHQFGMVHLGCDVTLEQLDMPALFSAVAVTQTTTDFSLRVDSKIYGEDAGLRFWKWVAYAFFSRRAAARSSIESLTITGVGLLTPEAVQGFASIVNAKHPEEELFGFELGHTSGKEATLKAGAPIKWEIDGQGHPKENSQPLVFASPVRFVRTFSDSGRSKWVNAIVPGLGHCQVQRSDLEFSRTREKRKADPSKVSAFTIRFHGFMILGEQDHLQDLLKVIGAQLKFLKIVCPANLMSNNMVLQGCPNLEKMELWRGVVNVGFDFTEQHKRNEPLSMLSFDGWEYCEFAHALSTTTDPHVLSVRRLLVHRLNPADFANVIYDSEINIELLAYLKMLKVNRSLEHLTVSLSTSFHKYANAFRAHHLEPIDRVINLPTASKVAFLSAVSPPMIPRNALEKHEGDVPSQARQSLCKLSHGLLSTIFEFGRSFVLREVYVILVKDGVPFGFSDDEDMGVQETLSVSK